MFMQWQAKARNYSIIDANLFGILVPQLRGKGCIAFSPNTKVRTDPQDLFSYPDLAIVCGEPIYHDKRRDVLLNPKVIFEVLSSSTEKYVRDEKFRRYRENIPSMTDYILVLQSTPKIEHFAKQDNGEWVKVDEATGLENEIYISSIDCHILLGEVYDNIAFQEN